MSERAFRHHSSHGRSLAIPPVLAESHRQSVTGPLLVLLGIFALFMGTVFALYFGPHPEMILGGASSKDLSRIRTVTLEDATFTIPRPYILDVDKRIFGPIRRISLRVPWPYEPGSVVSDADAGELDKILAIDLAERTETTSTADKLLRIYPVYLDGPGDAIGNGLARHKFKLGTPYSGMVLYVAQLEGAGDPVLFYCSIERGTIIPPLCERRLPVTDKVMAVYRFHERHLTDWQKLEGTVKQLLASLRPGGSRNGSFHP